MAATAAEKQTTASLGLFYYSRWKNADSASTFLRIYGAQIPRKYSNVTRRQKDEVGDSEQIYTTNEGDVLLSISGSTVFVSEGFDLALARKLRDSIAGVQAQGPLRTAQLGGEPSLSLSRLLGGYGLMKPATLGRYTFEGPHSSEPAQ
jgi:hypothetical protein